MKLDKLNEKFKSGNIDFNETTVFDIDGTLSIVGDRLECLKGKDWDSFYDRCDEDKVNRPIAKVMFNMMGCFEDVVLVSGRRESTRKKTLAWLKKNSIGIHSDNLYLRKDGDKRRDSIVKIELVADFIDKIEMVFEDRSSMVEKWRSLGITCLQVAEGDF